MTILRPPGPTLTGVEAALALLLDGLGPVAAGDEPLAAALGGIAAGTELTAGALPTADEAAIDGYAFHARDLAGASAYSPIAIAGLPAWVEAGQVMPAGCDCVVDAGLVDTAGPLAQVLAEAIPGEGIRRAGDDLAAGEPPVPSGRRVSMRDLLIARRAGLQRLAIRRPRLRVIDVGETAAGGSTTGLIIQAATAAGARLAGLTATARDSQSIGAAMDAGGCDLLIVVGGTGAGRTDHTAEALAARAAPAVHGIALQPGRTTAVGRLGATPVIALPGAADQALAGYLVLAQPVLDRLSGREARWAVTHLLARKIASAVGITELVLLSQTEDAWTPLAVGAFPLHRLAEADAWLAVPAGSEGCAPGTPVAAFPFSGI